MLYWWSYGTSHERKGSRCRAPKQRSIQYVRLRRSQNTLKNTQGGRRCRKFPESHRLKMQHFQLSAKKHSCGKDRGALFRGRPISNAHARTRRTQSDVEEVDVITNERGIYVATLEERRYYSDCYKVVQPNPRGGSNTVKTEERLEDNFLYDGECKNLTIFLSEPDAELWPSWSSWTWSFSTRSSWVRFFVVDVPAHVLDKIQKNNPKASCCCDTIQ